MSTDIRLKTGQTTEGYSYSMWLEYPPNEKMPNRIYGEYGAADGRGTFDVTTWRELPAVITESSDF